MQALFDLAPVAAFFVAYWLGGIYVATAVLMIAMVLLLVVDRLRLGRIPGCICSAPRWCWGWARRR